MAKLYQHISYILYYVGVKVDKSELIEYIKKSNIINKWHWFGYHFKFYLMDKEHPFAKSIVESCLTCESSIPGYAKKCIDDISQISGIDKDVDKEGADKHYNQLMQKLAELFIIKQVITYEWPTEAKFAYEPVSPTSNKNPEIVIELKTSKIGIEVKAPSILDHDKQRRTNFIQLTARNGFGEIYRGKEDVTFPRDNPVKDFLKSADEKFHGFKKHEKNFFGLLVIVWNDYIYEPITALQHHASGLFTQNSFAKDSNGNTLNFKNVDGVVIIRHLHQFMNAAGEVPLLDNFTDAFDFGDEHSLPNVYISNPVNEGVPESIMDCLRAYSPDECMGAEYMPQDVVFWVPIP